MNEQRRPEDRHGFEHVTKLSEDEFDKMFNIEHDNNDDPVAAKNSRKKIRMIIISTLVVLAVVAAGFLVFRIYSEQAAQEEQQRAEQEAAEREAEKQAQFEPTLPLLDAYGDATPPTPEDGTITTDMNDDGDMVSSEDFFVSHSEFAFRAPEVECSVSRDTDFCFSGELVTPEENANIHTYFLKNAPQSRMLENAENFEEVEVSGASKAALMTIQLGGESTPTVVVVQDDGTGYIFAAPGQSLDTVRGIANNLSVS